MARWDAYVIDIIDSASGDTIRSIQHDVPGVAVTDEDWERLPEVQWLRQIELESGARLEAVGYPGTPCPLDGMRPEYFPVLRTIVSDEVGRLWVEATDQGGFSLAVFDSSGRLVGEAPMPDRDPRVTPYARRNLLYIVTIDDFDVQGIEVYELRTER